LEELIGFSSGTHSEYGIKGGSRSRALYLHFLQVLSQLVSYIPSNRW
jgi:hypothetical protein